MPQPVGFSSDHFADTNVIIGYTVNWDRLENVVTTYLGCLDEGCTVHFSTRAIKEAIGVVRRQRRLAKRAARCVFEDFDPSGSHNEVEHIKSFVLSELGSGAGNPPVSGLGGLLEFIGTNDGLFVGLTQVNHRFVFEANASDIDAEFEETILLLEGLLSGAVDEDWISIYVCGEGDYSSLYTQFKAIDALLKDEPTDRDLLFDAFHFLQTNGLPGIVFVTDDCDDFISNRDEIEKELEGICIHTPNEVVEGADGKST